MSGICVGHRLQELASNANQKCQELKDKISELTKSFSAKFEEGLVVSLAESEDTASFWPNAFGSLDAKKMALAKPEANALELAIQVAQFWGNTAQLQTLKFRQQLDKAQRACLRFHLSWSELPSTSSLPPRSIEFEAAQVSAFVKAAEAITAFRDFAGLLQLKDIEVKESSAEALEHAGKMQHLVLQGWESNCASLVEALKSLHPKEKEWRAWIITKPDNKKIVDFMKSDDTIAIGKLSALAAACLAGVISSTGFSVGKRSLRNYPFESPRLRGTKMTSNRAAARPCTLACGIGSGPRRSSTTTRRRTRQRSKASTAIWSTPSSMPSSLWPWRIAARRYTRKCRNAPQPLPGNPRSTRQNKHITDANLNKAFAPVVVVVVVS